MTDPLPGLSAVTCPNSSLAPGESETCTATYATTQADVDRGSVTNTGTARRDRRCTGQTVTATSTVVVEAIQGPAIGLVKSANTATFGAAGTVLTYSYLVTNPGNVTLTSVGRDRSAAGPLCGRLPRRHDARAGRVRDVLCHVHDDPGRRRRGPSRQHRAPRPAPRRPVQRSPQRRARRSRPSRRPPSASSSRPMSAASRPPARVIHYSYQLTNTGTVTLTSVAVTDPLPGLSGVNCPSTTLAVGAVETCTATYTTTQADMDRGSVHQHRHRHRHRRGDGGSRDGRSHRHGAGACRRRDRSRQDGEFRELHDGGHGDHVSVPGHEHGQRHAQLDRRDRPARRTLAHRLQRRHVTRRGGVDDVHGHLHDHPGRRRRRPDRQHRHGHRHPSERARR